MTDVLGPDLVHVDVRPIRALYMVRSGSVADFRMAVHLASNRWGGIQELIIPVSPQGRMWPRWRQMIEWSPPDYIANVAELPLDVVNRVALDLGRPVVSQQMIDDVHHGMHQLAAYPPAELSNLQLAGAARRAPILTTAALGPVPIDNELLQAWRATGAVPYTEGRTAAIVMAQLSRRTVIGSTGRQCGEVLFRGSPPESLVVWCARSTNLFDAVNFWNLRALMPLSFGAAPMVALEEDTLADQAVHEALRSECAKRAGRIVPSIIFAGPAASKPGVANMLAAAGWDVHRETKISRRLGRRVDTSGPLTAAIAWDPRVIVGGERQPGVRASVLTTLDRTRTLIRTPSPVIFHPNIGGPVRVILSGPGHLSVPSSPSVAQLFHPHALPNKSGIELSTLAQAEYHFEIAIPERLAVLRTALSDRKITATPSDKGQLASGVRRVVGDAALISRPELIRAVDKLTTHRIEYQIRAIQEQVTGVTREQAAELARLFGSQVRQTARSLQEVSSDYGASGATVGPMLNELVASRLVRRGALVRCSLCGLDTFVDAEFIGSAATCPACGSNAAFVSSKSQEPILYYRLNALVDRASDNGVFVHLYAVAALEGHAPLVDGVPGCDLRSGNTPIGEADVLALVGSEIWMVEAKSTAGWFTETQIANDINRAREIGAEVYVLACLEPIPPQTLEFAATEASANGIRVAYVCPPSNRITFQVASPRHIPGELVSQAALPPSSP